MHRLSIYAKTALTLCAALALLAGCGEENGGTGAGADENPTERQYCACEEEAVAETPVNAGQLFCDSLEAAFGDDPMPGWETFASQLAGAGEWSRLDQPFRWESDLFALDWHRGRDSVAYSAWLDTIAAEMPWSSISVHALEEKIREAAGDPPHSEDSADIICVVTTDHYPLYRRIGQPRMIAKLFQQAGEWRYAYFALKESFVDRLGAGGDSLGLPDDLADEYLRLAYLAWRAGEKGLAEKNWRIYKTLRPESRAECDEFALEDDSYGDYDLGGHVIRVDPGNIVVIDFCDTCCIDTCSRHESVERTRKTKPISRETALDSVRSLYMELGRQQRVMWLAERGLVSPLSEEERTRWDARRAVSWDECYPRWNFHDLFGTADPVPVGYGSALEGEWAARDQGSGTRDQCRISGQWSGLRSQCVRSRCAPDVKRGSGKEPFFYRAEGHYPH